MTERLQVREIDDDEGQRLVRIIRRGSGSVVTWRRAQMVLLSAQGMNVAAIAKVAFTSEDRVRDVIRNFNADGFGSLYPKYKGGHPPKFTLGQRRDGAHEQAAALLARDPAAHAALDDPAGAARLRRAGAREQATALASRAAAHPPSAPRAAWPGCWTACGGRARTTRPPRWSAGCLLSAYSGSSSSRTASLISSVSDGKPTVPRPRHGFGKTRTYGLFPDCGDREATRVRLPLTRRIRKVSLDSSLSGRPELHCEAQLSVPAPRSLRADKTRLLSN